MLISLGLSLFDSLLIYENYPANPASKSLLSRVMDEGLLFEKTSLPLTIISEPEQVLIPSWFNEDFLSFRENSLFN